MDNLEVVPLPCTAPGVSRGSDFHYEGCGCAEVPWAGDLVDWIWHPSAVAHVQRLVTARSRVYPPSACRLRIAYLIPHHNVSGGMKMIMKQIEFLRSLGHWVQAVFRGPPGSSVLPPWASTPVDSQRLLGMADPLVSILTGVDVAIIGYFTQLTELVGVTDCPGPIVYWEQGHEHVFGDPTSAAEWDRVFHQVMHLPVVFLSVSDIIANILKVHFARIAPVIPNAIECDKWYVPSAGEALAAKHARVRLLGVRTSPSDEVSFRHVLLVGNPALRLKNHETALRALNTLAHHLKGRLVVTWICQIKPELSGIAFPVHLVVNPPQEDLPALYAAGHDAFLFPSVYEAWGMPVLEAMAAGVPVVTSRCYGVDMFCVDGDNALMVSPYDADAMSDALLKILQVPQLSTSLSARGRATATSLTWSKAMTLLEASLLQVHYCLGRGVPELSRSMGVDMHPRVLATERRRQVVDRPGCQVVVDCRMHAGQVFAPGLVEIVPTAAHVLQATLAHTEEPLDASGNMSPLTAISTQAVRPTESRPLAHADALPAATADSLPPAATSPRGWVPGWTSSGMYNSGGTGAHVRANHMTPEYIAATEVTTNSPTGPLPSNHLLEGRGSGSGSGVPAREQPLGEAREGLSPSMLGKRTAASHRGELPVGFGSGFSRAVQPAEWRGVGSSSVDWRFAPDSSTTPGGDRA